MKNSENTIRRFQTKCGRAIKGFLKEKKVQSKNTAIGYEGDINTFLEVTFNKTISTITEEELNTLDYEMLSNFRNGMFGEMANGTVNRYLTSVKSMMRHLKAVGMIESEIGYLDLVKRVRDDVQSYRHMPRKDVEKYMDATRFEKNKAEEKKMLIKLAADTALRQEELLSIKWKNISPEEDGYHLIEGVGKGGKRFSEWISKGVFQELEELRTDSSKVFSLNRKNVQDMMIRLNRILNYEDKNYVFHSFKKSAVSFTHDKTGSIVQAMRKGRHTKPETVMRYLEERDTGLLGMFSSEDGVPDDLFEAVSHEELLNGLRKVDKNSLLILNLKISEMIDN